MNAYLPFFVAFLALFFAWGDGENILQFNIFLSKNVGEVIDTLRNSIYNIDKLKKYKILSRRKLW